MSRQFYNLPSLNALATFEAVARNQSLTAAAAELGVTPGAVSRQIKLLENEIGIELLIRQHKKIQCNKNGKALYESLRLSFSSLSKTINEVSSSTDELTFTLGSTTAFSSLWLMPRLNRFWKKYPDVRINHNLADNATETTNETVDISIRYGIDNKKGLYSTFLFNDEIYPVCSPKLANKYNDINLPEQLINLPLLQLHHQDKSWTDWHGWLKNFNLDADLKNISSFNNYIIALQAAQDDQGILLGWNRLVKPFIRQGKLSRLMDASIESPGSYYLYSAIDKKLNTGARLFIQWLLEQNNLD